MYEDRPEKDTPKHVTDDLAEYGGRNPHGKPLWRLVLAKNCRVHCFGRKNHVEPGVVAALSDTSSPADVVPSRIEEGEFWIPHYQIDGWILERWFPASAWGVKEQWEGERAPDGRTRLLAAYPNLGDYMMMYGPWKSISAAGDLKLYLRTYAAQRRANPVNWDNSVATYLALDAKYRQEQADEYAEELEAQYRMGISGALKTVSSTSQKLRNAMSEYSLGGINLGAADKWGS